jgi:predicted RNA-binding Zn-ribbon protein involved in translation (DUF1610 family)
MRSNAAKSKSQSNDALLKPPPGNLEVCAMSKTEECDRCENFSGYKGEGFLVCAMHPAGPEETPCPDWDLVEDDWVPSGAAYVDGELVIAQAPLSEACDRNIEIILHPRFTGRCPECGNEFDRCQLPSMPWDCDRCGWMDFET